MEEDEEELPLRVEWRGEDSLKRILFPPVIQSWTRPGQLLSRWTDNFLGWFRGFRTGKRGKGARRSQVTITELHAGLVTTSRILPEVRKHNGDSLEDPSCPLFFPLLPSFSPPPPPSLPLLFAPDRWFPWAIVFLVFVEFQWIRGIVAFSSRLLVYTMPTVCISNSVIASIALGSTITFEVLILALLGLGCVCVPRCLRRDFMGVCVSRMGWVTRFSLRGKWVRWKEEIVRDTLGSRCLECCRVDCW